ncbi:MAG: DUF4215 domain-containing protein [Myxococcales bacterium]|nr:DUF4215 domain-containing protein [Myxococcales bacterium]
MSSVFSFVRTARRGGALGVALAAALTLAGCFESNTIECSSGVVCPEGSVCTADGLGCRQVSDLCGNSQMDPGEQCDDGNQIDEDDCRADCQTNVCGDGKLDLQGPDTEECDELGGADSATCDSDCTLPACGDMHTNPMFTSPGAPRGERCDDGNTASGDGCSFDCASDESCNDGYVNSDLPTTGATCKSATATGTNCAEVCDDGNNIAGDGCSPNCLSLESCRNGILDSSGGPANPPELCDDGDTDDTDECRNNCQAGFGCGNGFVDNDGPAGPSIDEECDNGTTTDSAACDGDCTIPVCGDNRFNAAAGEACDPGTVGVNVASCNSDCSVPACGDGKVNRAFTPAGGAGPEECDDGNTTAGDGCSALCRIETCGNGVTEMINGEQCDDGNLVDTDACRNTCQLPRCGDGVASASEACDAGANTQACNLDCTVPACGDGKTNRAFTPAGAAGPEQCDDSNTTAGDGCSATCQIETCGNMVVEAINGEQCDDGNLVDTDACRNTCQFPRCGDGIASASETCDTNGNSQTCNLDCSAPACGDGKLNPAFTPAGAPGPEQCDDSNTTSGDGCSNRCQVEPFALSLSKGGTGTGTVTSAPAGINCGADCTELYPVGTMVTITGAPGASAVFTGWAGGGCTGTAPCVVAMSAARNVVATFDLNTLTVVKAGNGTGTVTGTGINCGTGVGATDCTENYNASTMVTLTATAGVNSTFAGWAGGGCSGLGACTTTMAGAATITATFTLNSIPLTVTLAGNGTGVVTSVPAGINCGIVCSAGYDAETVVTLSAAPAGNNTFTGWSGAGCSGTSTCTVTMSAARAVTATFTLNQHQLSVVKAGNGGGTVTSSPAGINCGADCTENYNAGTMVVLTAAAAGDSTFTGWSGTGITCPGTTPCTVTVNAATAVTATFALQTFTLSVSRTGTGSGTVTSVPSGINCGGTCMAAFNAGTLVTLTPVAGGNSAFTGWSGDCTGLTTCTVTMNAARSVVANFDTDVRILTVVPAGTGSGTVTSNPAGITCGGTCTAAFAQGSMVTLTAAPSSDSNFTSWSGASGCTTSTTCVVTMNNAATVTATYTLKSFTLTAVISGGASGGSGTVTSVPSVIACPGTCASSFNAGAVVGLVAAPAANSTFTGWSGGGCSGTGVCIVTISASVSVTATFEKKNYPLTVVKAGGGGGTVTSAPAGINCGGTCVANFTDGASVVLTAVASGGSTFTGWAGGGCSGTGTCSVTMAAATTVTATFAQITRTLTVTPAGTGTGTVTSNPTGITCGGDCTEAYVDGSVVVLTAVPAVGSSFAGWAGGGCSGTGTCVVTMTATTGVTATFTLNTFALTVNVTPGGTTGSVTSAPAGITGCTMAGCNASFNFNQAVVLTATLGDAATVAWTGCDSMTATTCTVTITAARAVGATFAP